MSARSISTTFASKGLRALAWLVAMLSVMLSCACAARADLRKMALVVGNANYEHTRALSNTRNDAEAMAAFLRSVGFEVFDTYDLKYGQFRSTVRDFAKASTGADIAVVYFAGHGLEAAGVNYLLPVDAKLATSADLEYEAITLNAVLDVLREQRLLNLIIIDACRNNPLADRMAMQAGAVRSVRRGLARLEPKGDVLVAFAAAAGSVAHDGAGRNSPFLEALVRHLGAPGVDVRVAFGGVRDAVLGATNNDQEPVIYGSLGGRHISLVPLSATSGAPPTAAFREQDAKVAWEGAKESCDTATLKLFATRYANTFFGDLATKRIAEIEAGSVCHAKSAPRPSGELARLMQIELRRVGCFAGAPTGTWGPRSVEAMRAFQLHSKISVSTQPNEDALHTLRGAKGRVCPLQCGPDERVQAGRCVSSTSASPAIKQETPVPADVDKPMPTPAPKAIVTDTCEGVRSACAQVRTKCMKTCRDSLADRTYGNCNSCLTTHAVCVSRGSNGTCK